MAYIGGHIFENWETIHFKLNNDKRAHTYTGLIQCKSCTNNLKRSEIIEHFNSNQNTSEARPLQCKIMYNCQRRAEKDIYCTDWNSFKFPFIPHVYADKKKQKRLVDTFNIYSEVVLICLKHWNKRTCIYLEIKHSKRKWEDWPVVSADIPSNRPQKPCSAKDWPPSRFSCCSLGQKSVHQWFDIHVAPIL